MKAGMGVWGCGVGGGQMTESRRQKALGRKQVPDTLFSGGGGGACGDSAPARWNSRGEASARRHSTKPGSLWAAASPLRPVGTQRVGGPQRTDGFQRPRGGGLGGQGRVVVEDIGWRAFAAGRPFARMLARTIKRMHSR